MKYAIPAAVAMSLLAGGLAQAQTSGTSPSGTTTTTPANRATTPSTVGATSPSTAGTTTGQTGIGTTGVGTTSRAVGTNATGAPNRDGTNGAVNTSSAQPHNAPVPGANSFTEGEARRRIQDKGFGQVTGLKLDNQGIWRGTASKDGKSTSVALDYQGNVVGQ